LSRRGRLVSALTLSALDRHRLTDYALAVSLSAVPTVSWSWQMDADFAQSTGIKLQGDTSHIAVSTVTEISDINGEQVCTEISIPIESMNTVELDEWLGNGESKSGLHGELVGYNGDGTEVFVLQIKNFTIRSRISSSGAPTTIASGRHWRLPLSRRRHSRQR
jgi:hypothetical protein